MRLDELFPEISRNNTPYENFGNPTMPPKKKKRKKDKKLEVNPAPIGGDNQAADVPGMLARN